MKSRPARTESKPSGSHTVCVCTVYRRLVADVSCWWSPQAAVESFNDAPNICSIARISHFWSKFERVCAPEGVSARIRRIQWRADGFRLHTVARQHHEDRAQGTGSEATEGNADCGLIFEYAKPSKMYLRVGKGRIRGGDTPCLDRITKKTR